MLLLRISAAVFCQILFIDAFAETKGFKNAVWSVGTTVERFALEGEDSNELTGTAGLLQFGGGFLGERFAFLGSANLILGPYEEVRSEDIKTDFGGTGFTAWTYYAVGMDLRHPKGSYGFCLGLDYTDMVGRSVSKSASKDDRVLDNYVIRSAIFSVIPGFFFAWLEPARPKGNTPELLATRIEGYVLTIAYSYPLIADYKVKYTTAEPNGNNEQSFRSSGDLKGYAVIVGFGFLLGV